MASTEIFITIISIHSITHNANHVSQQCRSKTFLFLNCIAQLMNTHVYNANNGMQQCRAVPKTSQGYCSCSYSSACLIYILRVFKMIQNLVTRIRLNVISNCITVISLIHVALHPRAEFITRFSVLR